MFMKVTIRKGAGLLLFSLTTEGSKRPSYIYIYIFKTAFTWIVMGVFCERHSHILAEIRSSRGRKLSLPFAAD